MENATELVKRFVCYLNDRGLEPLFGEDVSQELRTKELPDISDMFAWQIRPAPENPWVSAIEQLLPYRWPILYRSLISSYRFAEFEVGPVMFFGNTGLNIFHDISRAIFADEGLYPLLQQNGYIQFGQQAGGHYDPVCFAMKESRGEDGPILRLDHEEVLINNRIRVSEKIAPSFRDFMERVIAGEIAVR